MTPPQPQPQQEYIIQEDYIVKLDEWLSEHGIAEFERFQIRTRLRLEQYSRPATTPCSTEATDGKMYCATSEEYERLLDCPNSDIDTLNNMYCRAEGKPIPPTYALDIKIRKELREEAIRNAMLDLLYKKANQHQLEVETELGDIVEVIEKGEVLAWIDELRISSTKETPP